MPKKHFVSPPHQDPRGAGSASSISERVLYTAFRGECVGQLAMLTGEANFYNCKAKETSRVAIITRYLIIVAIVVKVCFMNKNLFFSRDAFFSMASGSPGMVLGLARSVVAKLSPTVRQASLSAQHFFRT